MPLFFIGKAEKHRFIPGAFRMLGNRAVNGGFRNFVLLHASNLLERALRDVCLFHSIPFGKPVLSLFYKRTGRIAMRGQQKAGCLKRQPARKAINLS
jgi:hypothetical protein